MSTFLCSLSSHHPRGLSHPHSLHYHLRDGGTRKLWLFTFHTPTQVQCCDTSSLCCINFGQATQILKGVFIVPQLWQDLLTVHDPWCYISFGCTHTTTAPLQHLSHMMKFGIMGDGIGSTHYALAFTTFCNNGFTVPQPSNLLLISRRSLIVLWLDMFTAYHIHFHNWVSSIYMLV